MTAGLLFTAIVLAVAALFVAAVAKAAQPALRADRGASAALVLVPVFWLAVPAFLAAGGFLDRYSPVPPPGFILFALLTAGTVVLAFSRLATQLIAAIPLAGLVGYQVFRVPLELVLHRLYAEGVVPVEMTYSGRNFDILSGASAAAVALWLLAGHPGRRLVAAWNIVGLVLLVNIVAVALLAAPVPFRAFTTGPANLLPSTLPYVWLPTFLVQAALFGHLLVFRALRASRAARDRASTTR